MRRAGVSVETAAHFGAGFAPNCIVRGRFAIPVHDPAGTLLAYCGHRERREPHLALPQRLRSAHAIFNENRIVESDLLLVSDPFQVLTARESGIENVVSFLTENITALHEQLAALMDERKCEHLEMF